MVNGTADNKGAPIVCAMVYWGWNYEKFYNIFLEFGVVVFLANLKSEKKINCDKQALLFVG